LTTCVGDRLFKRHRPPLWPRACLFVLTLRLATELEYLREAGTRCERSCRADRLNLSGRGALEAHSARGLALGGAHDRATQSANAMPQ
jgi:hypothetical protein